MADKFIQLHPTNETTNLIDEEVNLYPLIKPNSFKNFETEGETFEPQKKLVSGTNIKSLTVDGEAISLLGTGSINLPALLLNIFYPIGSIYMSTVKDNENEDVCPLAKFGGTWERIKDRFLWAKGDSDELLATGGSKDAVVVEHTHTAGTVPSHSHSINSVSLTGRIAIPGNFVSVPISRDMYADHASGQTYIEQATQKHLLPEGIFSVTIDSVPGLNPPIAGAASDGGAGKVTRVAINATHNHTMSSAGEHSHSISSTGVDGTNKNMPPYLVVMIWKRIA